MEGILIVAHAGLAPELLAAAQAIMGEVPNVRVLPLREDDTRESMQRRMAEFVAELDQGEGVLILADLLGGTPANASLGLLKRGAVVCLTGVNLPMLLEAITQRGATEGVTALAARCRTAASHGIRDLNDLLRDRIS